MVENLETKVGKSKMTVGKSVTTVGKSEMMVGKFGASIMLGYSRLGEVLLTPI